MPRDFVKHSRKFHSTDKYTGDDRERQKMMYGDFASQKSAASVTRAKSEYYDRLPGA